MVTKCLRTAAVALSLTGLMVLSGGCACGKWSGTSVARASLCDTGCGGTTSVKTTSTMLTNAAPPGTAVGECFATVFLPAKFETVSEKVCVKPASERVEIVPAQYEWVEEKVCVKEASKQLIEIPAEYRTETRTVNMDPGHTEWVREESAHCRTVSGQPVREVFCLVSHPPTLQTYTSDCLVKPATVKEVIIPAEFQMVRRQKLVCEAATRRIPIPAEYQEITKTLKTASARFEWQKVICEGKITAEKKNEIKRALLAAGFAPGAQNGEFEEKDWTAIVKFQEKNGMGTGGLTNETVQKLGVKIQ